MKSSLSSPNFPNYYTVYRKLKQKIIYQRKYTFFLCLLFFSLQYSIPLLSGTFTALLGSGTLGLSDKTVVLMGIIVTILSSLNSVIKPAESYDWAAYFSNRFDAFDNVLDLKMAELKVSEETKDQDYLAVLEQINQELAQLIEQSNQRQISLFKTAKREPTNPSQNLVNSSSKHQPKAIN